MSTRLILKEDYNQTSPDEAEGTTTLDSAPSEVIHQNVILGSALYNLPAVPAHANVRKIEQGEAVSALRSARIVWIIAEWGMGEDGFLFGIRRQIQTGAPVYRLDLSGYTGRDSFLNSLVQTVGSSFERFCQLMADIGDVWLLFDHCPSGEAAFEAEIESIAEAVLEYCPSLKICLRSRRFPQHTSFKAVQIRPLDEADLRGYLADHDKGDKSLLNVKSIELLHRVTDGVPIKIDKALRELEVVSLHDLANSDTGTEFVDVVADPGARSLNTALKRFAALQDPQSRQSFEMLKVLSLFPRGEVLHRIKRFNSNSSFYNGNATELRDHAFIEVDSSQILHTDDVSESVKILVVPRPIRERVLEELNPDESYRLNRRAAELYFGPDALNGSFKPPPAYQFNKPTCGRSEIANANALIVRLIREGVRTGNGELIERSLGLADLYLRALARGDHYQSGVHFCEDLLSVIPDDENEDKLRRIKIQYARCLRMTTQQSLAKNILVELCDDDGLPKAEKQGVLLSLAMCHEDLDEIDEARDIAAKVVKFDRHSFAGLQAKSLLIDTAIDDPQRDEKLEAHERIARRRDATVVANNIALTRARETENDPDRVRELLLPVIKSKDFYNKTRAAIELARISLKNGKKLSDPEKLYLIGAYHFLFSERLPGMFDKCHGVLWEVFASENDTRNLLALFRHSSLCWRLSGKERTEQTYLRKLALAVGGTILTHVSNLSREAAYYLARSEGAAQ